MTRVRATDTCFVGNHYRRPGDEFDYEGEPLSKLSPMVYLDEPEPEQEPEPEAEKPKKPKKTKKTV